MLSSQSHRARLVHSCVTSSPRLPCTEGCTRWFHNVSGLKQHIRKQHSIDYSSDSESPGTSGSEPVSAFPPPHNPHLSDPHRDDIPPTPRGPPTASFLSSSSPSSSPLSCAHRAQMFPESPRSWAHDLCPSSYPISSHYEP
jgi:hypothetical protein